MRSQLSVLWSILFEHVNAGRAVAYRLNHALPDDLHTTKRTKTEVSNIPPLLLISLTQTHTPRLTLFLKQQTNTRDVPSRMEASLWGSALCCLLLVSPAADDRL